MAPLVSALVAGLLASTAMAHFTLQFPATAGFDDDAEGNGPCGGATIDFSKNNVTDFHVGGDTIYLQNFHAEGYFLFRATLDQSLKSGWVNLRPVIQQVGTGAACQPQITVPSNYTGQKGVLQIASNGPDGNLYQCAALNFVSGAGPTAGSGGCNNASGVQINYAANSALSSLSSTSNTISSGSSPSGSGTSSTAKATTSSAASGTVVPKDLGIVAGLAWAVMVGVGTGVFRLL